MFAKPTNKYSINTTNKYYAHMILGDCFHLASVTENSILTTLKATQVSKAAVIENLSWRFLKVFSKPITDLCNPSITSEIFPEFYKLAKLKSLHKKGSLTRSCNYKPTSLLPQTSKVIERAIHSHTSNFLNLEKPYLVFKKKHSMYFCLPYFKRLL